MNQSKNLIVKDDIYLETKYFFNLFLDVPVHHLY